MSDEIVRTVTGELDIPVLVGGGIRTPDEAASKVRAGARFVVTGSALERGGPVNAMKAFADAVHQG